MEARSLAAARARALPARRRRLLRCLFGVSALGALDIGQFLATNGSMFRAAPGRAAGSALGLALWLVLAGLAGAAASGARSGWLSRSLVALSGLLAVGSLGLVAVHAAARVGGWRPALGGVLGLAALGLAYLAWRE
ncbi:MAG: hypothetical protein WAO09_06045 [Candidatus Dormiibacterota bacterium]